jgi:hypothetical protein
MKSMLKRTTHELSRYLLSLSTVDMEIKLYDVENCVVESLSNTN